MERISIFFSWAMHREAEHPSSTHARKKILDFDPGHDLEPRFRVKAYFHIYWSK